MKHFTLYTIGKIKEPWLKMAIAEYSKRLSSCVAFKTILAKDNAELEKKVLSQKNAIGLDAKGHTMTSEEWSSFLHEKWNLGGSHINFVIGGAEGLPQNLKKRLPLVSFSSMTFTHQITRLILFEGVYRAVQIFQSGKYHK